MCSTQCVSSSVGSKYTTVLLMFSGKSGGCWCCSVLQCVAVCCSVLPCVVIGCTATHCNTLQHTATHCNTLLESIYTHLIYTHVYNLIHACTHTHMHVCVFLCVCVFVCLCVCVFVYASMSMYTYLQARVIH